jgi:uncharacterized membrane protein
MPRLSRRTHVALAVVVAFAVGAGLVATQVEAICTYSNPLQTEVMTGSGSTCTAATADLNSDAEGEAWITCFEGTPVSMNLVITEECHTVGSEVQVSGYLTFRCRFC